MSDQESRQVGSDQDYYAYLITYPIKGIKGIEGMQGKSGPKQLLGSPRDGPPQVHE